MFSKRKGRVLKARLGYNANSSSLAAFVTYFLWGSAAVVLLVNTIAAAAFSGKARHDVKQVCDERQSSSV
ncbi:MAG: hypothetical protein ACM3ZC_00760 [Bacteroidota bacterium]